MPSSFVCAVETPVKFDTEREVTTGQAVFPGIGSLFCKRQDLCCVSHLTDEIRFRVPCHFCALRPVREMCWWWQSATILFWWGTFRNTERDTLSQARSFIVPSMCSILRQSFQKIGQRNLLHISCVNDQGFVHVIICSTGYTKHTINVYSCDQFAKMLEDSD